MSDAIWIDPHGVGRAALEGTALDEAWVEAAREHDLDPSELTLGVELARMHGASVRGPLVRLVAALRLALARGSTRLPLDTPVLHSHLESLAMDGVAKLAATLLANPAHLAPWSGGPGSDAPLVVDDGHLYSAHMHALERRVALSVRERLGLFEVPGLERVVQDVEAAPPRIGNKPLRLAKGQRLAVREACRGRLTLISGEPGTGKTFIVVAILRALARLGVPLERVVLAAPTGKAADRMRRSVERSLMSLTAPSFDDRGLLSEGIESRTLHRLLGYSPARATFRHHERNPLAQQVVIVDESSMIDVAMLDRLLRSLAPDAQLILLGDAEQLPSVDAGAVFRDLCKALRPWGRVVRLDESFRMDPRDPAGRHILTNARRVHSGKSLHGKTGIRRRGELESIERQGVEHLDVDLNAFLRWWDDESDAVEQQRTWVHVDGAYRDRDALAALFNRSERARILCLTRGRQTGIHAINQQFHAWRAESRARRNPPRFLVGEPILVIRNDYERELFNGDQGLVLNVELERRVRPCAVFRRADGFATYPLETVAPILELAHAVTVHKAQGSEFDRVAVVLPRDPIPLLTREMLYTAITRARQSVVLVGPKASLDYAVSRRIERSSGLLTFIRGESAGLCRRCAHHRVVISTKGSEFVRCTAPEMPKYPQLPVLQCGSYAPPGPAAGNLE